MSTYAELQSLLRAANEARTVRPSVPLALATLVGVDGSSYRQPGAQMLCDADGRVLDGAISGGCLEADVATRAAAVCESGGGVLVSYDLREDLENIWGFGTGCEGVAHVVIAPLASTEPLERALALADARQSGVLLTTVTPDASSEVGRLQLVTLANAAPSQLPLCELVLHTGAPSIVPPVLGVPVLPPPHLVLVGATRGAEGFAAVAGAAGWGVTVIDHRETSLAALSLAPSEARLTVRPEQAVEALRTGTCLSDARTFYALCTHRFAHDQQWLAALLPTRVPYIGVLGSRQRAARLVHALTAAGQALRARDHARIYAPIGLDLGGESPTAIALSAIAEMQSVLHSRPGGSLRERRTPLHTRSDTPTLGAASASAAVCAVDATRASENARAAGSSRSAPSTRTDRE